MKALVVQTDGRWEVKDLAGDSRVMLHRLQNEVGGFIEAVSGDGWVAYVNEEGKLEGLPVNRRATAVLSLLRSGNFDDVIVGPAVFLGSVEGDEADVPALIVAMFAGPS